MEMPRFSVELLVTQGVIGSIHNKREGYFEGFNQRVRIDLDGDGWGGLGHHGNTRKAGSGRITIGIAAGTAGLRRDDGAGGRRSFSKAVSMRRACDFLVPWRDPGAGVALAGRKNEACEIAETRHIATILVARPRVLRAGGQWPDFACPFCADAVLADPDDRAVDDRIFEIRVTV